MRTSPKVHTFVNIRILFIIHLPALGSFDDVLKSISADLGDLWIPIRFTIC